MKHITNLSFLVLLTLCLASPMGFVQEDTSEEFEMFESTLMQAQQQIEQGKQDDAISTYLSVLTSSPFKRHKIIAANVLAGEMWKKKEMQSAIDFYTIVLDEIGDEINAYDGLSKQKQQLMKDHAQRRIYEIRQIHGLSETDKLTAARNYYMQVRENTDLDELKERARARAANPNGHDSENQRRGLRSTYSHALGEYIFQLMHHSRYEAARNLIPHYIEVTRRYQDALYYEQQIMTLQRNEFYDNLQANRGDGPVDNQAVENMESKMIAESNRLIDEYADKGVNVAAAYHLKIVAYSGFGLDRPDLMAETFDAMLKEVPFIGKSEYYYESSAKLIQRYIKDERLRERLIGDYANKRDSFLSSQTE